MGATKSSTTRCMLDMKTCLAYDWIRLFDDRYTLLLVWSIWWNSPLYHFSQYSCVKVDFSYPYDVICLIFHVIFCFTDITFLDNWIATLCCAFADLSALFSWNTVHGPPSRTLNCHSAGCLMISLNLCSDAPYLFFSLRTPWNKWCAGFFSLGTYALVYEWNVAVALKLLLG